MLKLCQFVYHILNVLCEYDNIILIVIVILCVHVMDYMVCRFGCNMTRAEIEQFDSQIKIFWNCLEIMMCSRPKKNWELIQRCVSMILDQQFSKCNLKSYKSCFFSGHLLKNRGFNYL